MFGALLAVWGMGGGGEATAATFGDDLAFLKEHGEVVVLTDSAQKAQVAVSPKYQGRVLTSTADGADGLSFGWINRELIGSGQTLPHMNAFGGEDRFWLGPEGGQFSIFFAKGVSFDLEHWFTPAPVDTEPFNLVRRNATRARFRSRFALTNYSGTRFEVLVNRSVQLLSPEAAWGRLNLKPSDGVKMVAFESVNQLSNAGEAPWRKETGLLSIWILGMFTPSLETTIVIPINEGSSERLGPPVNADYFGTVPPDRLQVKDGVIYFSGDGKYRSKIGINPKRARPTLGSYDARHHVLTLVQFTLPGNTTDYVNSMWELQEHPFAGDAANSYNDGPPAPGAQPLGPFFEMESSSPAASLASDQTIEHVHRTIHLTGSAEQMDPIARAVLGVGLNTITNALPR